MSPMFFFISILYSLIFTQYSYSHCIDNQKSLLLQLKKELIFNSSMSMKLVQWNQSNECCKWYGVECNGAGYIISLQLDDEYISGGIGDSSTLFRFKYLEKLNLAYNDFNSTQIPRGIHNLTYLTHLNLSHAMFGGHVPAEISSLGRLICLDISESYTMSFQKPNLETFLQNLTGLRELYLDSVNITTDDERRTWSHIISSYLPNLTALSLKGCYLSGPLAESFWQLRSLSILQLDNNDLSTVVPHLFASFSSLTALSVSWCGLNGSFPEMLFQLPTLQYLDLSGNDFLSGSIPSSISNLKKLSVIDMSHCKLTGSIPSTFANLTQLTYVDLSLNMFTGTLSSTMFEGLSNLAYLHLGENSFSGNIPQSLFGLPTLLELQLNYNQFSGQVEEFSIVNVSDIVILMLGHNRLEGPIPNSFFQIRSLQTLSLSGNLFNGTFQLEKIQNLVSLTILGLSYNNLSIDLGNDSSSPYGFTQLDILNLASCNMHDFPHFIQHLDVRALDLSYNLIGGEIPSWIWGTQLFYLNLSFNLLTHVQKPYHIPTSLETLDLQSNQLREELHLPFPPNAAPHLVVLVLGNNGLTGSIPTSLCTATQLRALDLSMNKLSGTIPSCLLDGTINLSVLDLGRNNISGHIPDSFTIAYFCVMTYFDVNNNTLEGKIPESLKICHTLEFLNVGNNIINDTFPCMLSSSLRVLVLHSNRLHGEVKCNNNSWPVLQILDISSNDLIGNLEAINFSSWRAMALNNDAKRRHNHSDSDLLERSAHGFTVAAGVRIIMKGKEVEIVKIWSDFTAIDLSCNKFQGEIPNAIGDLNTLHLLNLSHNALNGRIPKSFGKMGDLESLDLSQNQLAGHIPEELGQLTFLSFLNLSYNKLAGVIPKGSQFLTFSADSFKGNSELCGFPLNLNCTRTNENNTSPRENENVQSEREIEWEYVCAALGYVVGLGIIAWLLLFCRRFRVEYFGKIDEVVEEMFDARDRRQRRRRLARREVMIRNRVRRR